MAHARDHISEPAAVPKHLEILPELPKTAVGKVFKPDLRRRAIARVFDAALPRRGRRRGSRRWWRIRGAGWSPSLVPGPGGRDDAEVSAVLGGFVTPWRWQDEPASREPLAEDGAGLVSGR